MQLRRLHLGHACISFIYPNKVPANMGCTVAAQPIGFNRTRSHPINLSFAANWKQPNQAISSLDQFYNAAGPSGPRNTLQLLSHQVNHRAGSPPRA